jgi:ABC-2 family transporter protein
MYARLWWKDARQFWPIWVFLALAAAVLQGLFLHYLGQSARQGMLGLSALICASLYAFATASAAFAGEREAGTLRLLDNLPADRRVVWMSKFSFSFATTLALALILLGMAALSTDKWKPQGLVSFWEVLNFDMILLLALGWGLFWSAILKNALTAAVMAICSTGVSLGFLLSHLDSVFLNEVDLSVFAAGNLVVFLVTLIASVVIFAGALRWKRAQVEFRSPIVVSLADPANQGQTQGRVQSPLAHVLGPRPAAPPAGSLTSGSSLRQSWVVEARALAWQTMRQGWKTWALLLAIGLVLSAAITLRARNVDFFFFMLIDIGVTLVGGASVFGLDTQARSQRFLAHHGARPSLVWLIKVVVWGTGIGLLWGPLAAMGALTMRYQGAAQANGYMMAMMLIPLFLGVALVCGMAIRRGITAVVVALVIGLGLMIPFSALTVSEMLPVSGLLVIPAGLLLVSWAWCGEWLLDRPGVRRWVHLGLLLAGMFTLASGWYAGYRAWDIRDVGPIAPPASWVEAAAAPVPADQNAADLYREAARRLVGPFKDSPEFLEKNREILDPLRRAVARPDCRFLQPERLTVLDRPDLPPLGQLAHLFTLDASERQNRGDLAGAWDDIVALFRMAHHLGDGAVFAVNSISVERMALGQALEWAVARGQTPERLHSALAAYRALPKIPPATDMMRAEANLVENALDLPTSRLREWALETTHKDSGRLRAFDAALFDLASMPWERVRARRVNRLISSNEIEDSLREPWQRSRAKDPEVDYAQRTSRNAMMLIRNLGLWFVFASDQNEVARRALVQVLALRAWQLKHGGQFPKTLEALVPEELADLPNDPYSGQPFRYLRSSGREVVHLRYALTPMRDKLHGSMPGSWLIYSVGPDFHDDGGIDFEVKNSTSRQADIVFEIPPLESGGGVNGRQNQIPDSSKDRTAPADQPVPRSPQP